MAFCTNCGHEISPLAATCPQCGQPTGVTAAPAPAPGVPGLVYADFWSRFAAALIDGIILIVPGVLAGIGGRYTGSLVLGFLYHWLLIAYWNGQTLGKKLLNIRIAHPDGSPVDIGPAAARSAMRIVSGIPLGLGFLWAAWDPEKRTWHDMVANTRAFRV